MQQFKPTPTVTITASLCVVGDTTGVMQATATMQQAPGLHDQPPSAPAPQSAPAPKIMMTPLQQEQFKQQLQDYTQIVCRWMMQNQLQLKQTPTDPTPKSGATVMAPSPQASAPSSTVASQNAAPKLPARWSPSGEQLAGLEKLFALGSGTPSKPRIKEIALELQKFGPISETNVYNWFQNRKARAKRKEREDEEGNSGNRESPSQPSSSQPASPQEVLVTVDGKLWRVPGGMLDVRTTFGEGTVLYDPQGNVLPTNARGIVLKGVVHKSVFTTKKPGN